MIMVLSKGFSVNGFLDLGTPEMGRWRRQIENMGLGLFVCALLASSHPIRSVILLDFLFFLKMNVREV
jgi:hypothetical protein